MPFTCFSSWAKRNDISREVNYKAISVYNDKFIEKYAFDGYYCKQSSEMYFISRLSYHSWYEIDLLRPRKISCVRIQTRGNVFHSSRFNDVALTFGNMSINENYKNNPLIHFFKGETPLGAYFEICDKFRYKARYLIFQRVNSTKSFLALGEIQILE